MREATMAFTVAIPSASPTTPGYGCITRGQGVRVWTE